MCVWRGGGEATKSLKLLFNHLEIDLSPPPPPPQNSDIPTKIGNLSDASEVSQWNFRIKIVVPVSVTSDPNPSVLRFHGKGGGGGGQMPGCHLCWQYIGRESLFQAWKREEGGKKTIIYNY